MQSVCDRCSGPVGPLGVCDSCGRHTPLTAYERVGVLASSFDEQDAPLVGGDPLRFETYLNDVYAARVSTGLSEAAVWGWAEIDGCPCALAVLDFRFLGGSMGVAVGEKLARALDGAREAHWPFVVVTSSGGARMQEGMAALVQMAKLAEARRRHAHAGLPQVTLMASPTTGGVLASIASLGDAILCEPGALVGFAGPRVAKLATGETPHPQTYTPEHHLAHGTVDAIVPRGEQRAAIGRLLRSLSRTPLAIAGRDLQVVPNAHPDTGAWERLRMSRDPGRPHAPAILDVLLDDGFELRGDRAGADDPAIVVRVGAVRPLGARVMAIGEDASAGRITPAGFRKAVRAIKMAGRLRLPVLTLIDTPGADPGAESEAAGIAAAIAETLTAMLECPSPTLALLTGEGGSGGALALVPADRVLAWENAVFSVIDPAAAAEILHRRPDQAPVLAEELRISAPELVGLGIADEVLSEPDGGAQADPDAALAGLAAAVSRHLGALIPTPAASRLGNRRRRWRRTAGDWLRVL